MLFEPFEPQQHHDSVGAVFSKVKNPGPDIYGATALINELLQYLPDSTPNDTKLESPSRAFAR